MRNHQYIAIAILALVVAAGCKKNQDKPAGGSGQATGSAVASGSGSGASGAGSGSGSAATAPEVPAKDIDSKDILGRSETAKKVFVKHVLLAWKELAPVFQGRIDPRAAQRTNEDTAKLAEDIAAKLKAKPDSIDDQIKEHGEDPGSAGGEAYTVKADSQFVPEFKNLALRLKEKEVGIVKSKFGYHVMERVLGDPLESSDILAREPEAGPVFAQHVLIGWKDVFAARTGRRDRVDKRALERTKADADKLAKEVLDKVRANGDMTKLMKQYSEDPGSKDSGQAYEVAANTAFVPEFKDLALRLKMGEAGLVKTQFGWHIIKRIPPPPPDPLESVDILKREPVTQTAKVKHILLSWSGGHPRDERGKKRDRATLDKLVKSMLEKLRKGDKIEPLMADVSEDPGSASTGKSYDVTPDAGLVEPFKNLSLRLKVGEAGVVKTDFGFHIIQRVE